MCLCYTPKGGKGTQIFAMNFFLLFPPWLQPLWHPEALPWGFEIREFVGFCAPLPKAAGIGGGSVGGWDSKASLPGAGHSCRPLSRGESSCQLSPAALWHFAPLLGSFFLEFQPSFPMGFRSQAQLQVREFFLSGKKILDFWVTVTQNPHLAPFSNRRFLPLF